MTTWPAKDPDEKFDYRWTIELDEGDSLVLAGDDRPILTLVSGTVTIDEQTPDADGLVAWISGGADEETAVFNAITTTAAGRTIEETIYLPILASDTASVATLKAAFPAFSDVSRSSIAFWLTRAARTVDDTWPEDDRDHAQMLLAAHYLTLQGLGTGAEAQAAAAGASGFKTMRSGSLTLERFEKGPGASEYDATSYGQQFKALLKAVKGGPRVTATGIVPVRAAGYGYGPW